MLQGARRSGLEELTAEPSRTKIRFSRRTKTDEVLRQKTEEKFEVKHDMVESDKMFTQISVRPYFL